MPEGASAFAWKMLGSSVRGASHHRSGLPNQDALGGRGDGRESSPAILVVCDGHGSAKCFRSQMGARLAVAVAIQTLDKFVRFTKDQPLSAIKDAAERHLPGDLVSEWREHVSRHFRRHPFTTAELDRLEQGAGRAGVAAVSGEERHLVAYGSTILAVVVTQSYLLYLQLGDGDILTVSDRNQANVVSSPFQHSDELIANETTSLCMANAARQFRVRFQAIQDYPPALIMASTDGYSNSFASESDFHKVATDLMAILRTEGATRIKSDLSGWLSDASQSGSGDDVTLGVIYRADLTDGAPPDPAIVTEAAALTTHSEDRRAESSPSKPNRDDASPAA